MEDLLAVAHTTLSANPALVYLALGVGVFISAVALPYAVPRSDVRRDRLRAAGGVTQDTSRESSLRPERRTDWLSPYADLLEPRSDAGRQRARLMMLRAGYRTRFAMRAYYVLRVALAILGVIATSMTIATLEISMTPLMVLAWSVLGGFICFAAPSVWILRRQQQRQEALKDAFPDTLDTLLVCVEAGQSIDQAIVRVAREMSGAHPVMAEEFELLSAQLRAGRERALALRDLAERINLPDVASFVTTLIQSSDFGTSIGQALRIYASEMRTKRTFRAEEKANLLPVKLALATMFFTVPPLLLVLLAPSVVQVIRSLQEFGQ